MSSDLKPADRIIPRRRLTVWATTPVVFMVDQIMKMSVLQCTPRGEGFALIPGLVNIIPLENPGMALGAIGDFSNNTEPLAVAAIIAVGFSAMTCFLLLHFYEDRFAQLGLALILGGTLGNVFDRVRFGYVVDYLHFYYADVSCPVCNIADCAILLGVLILVFRYPGRGEKSNRIGD